MSDDLKDPAKNSVAPTRKNAFGLLAILLSSLLFSTVALFVKCLTRFGPFQIIFWRSVFVFLGTTAMLFWRREGIWGARGDRIVMLARGVIGFAYFGSFFYAIKLLPLGDAIAITKTSPMITGFGAMLLLNEAWGCFDALGSLLCIAGVLLIIKPSFVMHALNVGAAPAPPFPGALAALIAAFAESAVCLILRNAKHLCLIATTSYLSLIGLVLSPILCVAQGESFVWPEGVEWLGLVLLAGLWAVGQILLTFGLKYVAAGKATAIGYFQVVFAYVFQVLRHRPVDAMSMVGAGMIVTWSCVTLAKDIGGLAQEEVVAFARMEDEVAYYT